MARTQPEVSVSCLLELSILDGWNGQPLYIRATSALVKEAKQWVAEKVGYRLKETRDSRAEEDKLRKVVLQYLGGDQL